MPNYDYRCLKCDKFEEHFIPISKKDEVRTCSCGESSEMKRCMGAPRVHHGGAISAIKRAGGDWNDVLKKIKSASGSNSTIDHY